MVYLQRWHVWCHMKLLPSRRKLCVHHATMQSHIRKVYACLAVTCHLHFWENDQWRVHARLIVGGAELAQSQTVVALFLDQRELVQYTTCWWNDESMHSVAIAVRVYDTGADRDFILTVLCCTCVWYRGGPRLYTNSVELAAGSDTITNQVVLARNQPRVI